MYLFKHQCQCCMRYIARGVGSRSRAVYRLQDLVLPVPLYRGAQYSAA